MGDVIALRGRGNNGNELVIVERDGLGGVTITRDGVTASRGEADATLPRQRGDVLDSFTRGDPIGNFDTVPRGDRVPPPAEDPGRPAPAPREVPPNG